MIEKTIDKEEKFNLLLNKLYRINLTNLIQVLMQENNMSDSA